MSLPNRHARLAAIILLDDDAEAERRFTAFCEEWEDAYAAEFRRVAAEREWSQENIDSGWLDELPEQARVAYGAAADPAECARRDVPECEEPPNE